MEKKDSGTTTWDQLSEEEQLGVIKNMNKDSLHLIKIMEGALGGNKADKQALRARNKYLKNKVNPISGLELPKE